MRALHFRTAPALTDVSGMLYRRLCSTSTNTIKQIQANSLIVSGIQPTGTPHVGNYLGFVQNFVRIQNENTSARKMLFLADYHSISVGIPPIGELDKNVRDMAACLLACGIDPDRTTLFAQSQVPEHTELSWILSSKQSIARLQRLTQFKDKSGAYTTARVPLGLINYPVLQAADVLLYKGTHVPVGEDQVQHFNLIGQIAHKFNRIMSFDFFPQPVMITSSYPRIKSLRNPAKKMSKSDKETNSCIFITDSAETVRKKVGKAITDSLGSIEYDPVNRHGISNLLQICAAFLNQSVEQVVDDCQSLDVVGLKDHTSEAINTHLEPIRQSYAKYMRNPVSIVDVLSYGRHSAQTIARTNLKDLKERLGFYTAG